MQAHLIDPASTIIRIIIIAAGVGLGVVLLTRKKRHLTLGILQIVFSICAPLCMGAYCYISKRQGLDVVSDLELFANHLKLAPYGEIIPIILILLYIVLIIISTISVMLVIDDARQKKKK